MSDEDGRPNEDAQPQRRAGPPLYVGADRMTFHAPGRWAHIDLAGLIDKGDAATTQLLLYAVVLGLQSIDSALRALKSTADAQMVRVEQMQPDRADKIIRDVIERFENMGVLPKEAMELVRTGAGLPRRMDRESQG